MHNDVERVADDMRLSLELSFKSRKQKAESRKQKAESKKHPWMLWFEAFDHGDEDCAEFPDFRFKPRHFTIFQGGGFE